MAFTDITKEGLQSYRSLQKDNDLQNSSELNDWYNNFIQSMDHSYLPQYQSGLINAPSIINAAQLGLEDYGNSRYDSDVATLDELTNYQDYRAHRQSSLNKMGAGIGKGVALAATTFIDGTLGLLTGTVEGIASALNGEGGYAAVSKLWDNSVSNALKQVNDEMFKAGCSFSTLVNYNAFKCFTEETIKEVILKAERSNKREVIKEQNANLRALNKLAG